MDIGDVEGDRQAGIETLETKFGKENAAVASVAFYSLIMILDPLPFNVMVDERLHLDFAFLRLMSIPVASYFLVSKSLVKDQSKSGIYQLKRRVFVTRLVGSLTYSVGI